MEDSWKYPAIVWQWIQRIEAEKIQFRKGIER